MKKIFLSILITLLAMSVIGCTPSSSPGVPESSSSAPSEESSEMEIPSDPEEKFLETLDLSDWSQLPQPDKIVYFYDGGRSIEFTGAMEEYKQIFALNQRRFTEKFDLDSDFLQTSVEIEEYQKHADLLEYQYEEYNSVYFSLNSPVKDGDTNWISTLTKIGEYSRAQRLYGPLVEPTELVEYLESLTE